MKTNSILFSVLAPGEWRWGRLCHKKGGKERCGEAGPPPLRPPSCGHVFTEGVLSTGAHSKFPAWPFASLGGERGGGAKSNPQE